MERLVQSHLALRTISILPRLPAPTHSVKCSIGKADQTAKYSYKKSHFRHLFIDLLIDSQISLAEKDVGLTGFGRGLSGALQALIEKVQSLLIPALKVSIIGQVGE